MNPVERAICLTMVATVILVAVMYFLPAPRPAIPPDPRYGSAIPVAASPSSVERDTAGWPTGAPDASLPRPARIVGRAPSGPPASGAPLSTARPDTPRPAAAPIRPVSLRVTASGTGHSISGIATWYRWRIGQAAAGPRLRAYIGPRWRGTLVVVSTATRSIRVRLSDFCGCPRGRVIDLDYRSFARLAPLSRGIVSVKVTW